MPQGPKVCKACGWVYPSTQPGRFCKVCKAQFDEVICRTCKNVFPPEQTDKTGQCKACHAAERKLPQRAYHKRVRTKQQELYEALLARVKEVPTTYPVLTEAQWIEACRYFNGCAICGSEDIDSRGFFISFEQGGRYCDWNILPMCECCAKAWNATRNPFVATLMLDNELKAGHKHRNNLDKILSYIGGKL